MADSDRAGNDMRQQVGNNCAKDTKEEEEPRVSRLSLSLFLTALNCTSSAAYAPCIV